MTAPNSWLERKGRLNELLKKAEENHKKAGENIKLLRKSMEQKGFLRRKNLGIFSKETKRLSFQFKDNLTINTP